jgi:hypothetical protein
MLSVPRAKGRVAAHYHHMVTQLCVAVHLEFALDGVPAHLNNKQCEQQDA